MPVDPAEDQRGIAEVELGQPVHQLLVEGVPFEPRLERAARAGLGQRPDPPRVLLAALEAAVRVVDMGLFGGDVRVVLAHFGV